MQAKILKLNKAGSPQAWINYEQAALVAAKGQVLWSMGDLASVLHGGYRVDGERSRIEIPAIIAVQTSAAAFRTRTFTRCAYT